MPPPVEANHWRLFAQHAWRATGGNIDRAMAWFKEHSSGNVPPQLKRFIETWGPRDAISNAPGQGRKRKIPNELGKQLAKVYKRGFVRGGNELGFTSVRHAKQKRKRKFADIIETCGNPTDRTVRAAIKRADPFVTKVRQTAKTQLPDKVKKQRRRVADANLRRGSTRLHAVTWVDEITKTATYPSRRVAGDKRKGERVIDDPFAAMRANKRPKVHALLAVNYAVGPLHCEFLTGTTGGVKKKYMVRVCC